MTGARGLEVMELAEFGQKPMFTFPLTEEAEDERAALNTDMYPLHTHKHKAQKHDFSKSKKGTMGTFTFQQEVG